jgi:hypothetical protein
MIFERIRSVFKSGGESKAPPAAPPDPANEFKHPENHALFARLKENSQLAAPDLYARIAHPDLVPILYDLIGDNEVRKGSAYGKPVMASRRGVVFAYASGTHCIFFRLYAERLDAARQDGGRYDPTYGKDWVEFRVGGRIEGQADWREAMRRWCRISHRDSLTIE